MLEAIHLLRRGIIAKLTDAITLNDLAVPVYNRIPTDAVYPMIRVYSVSTDEINENQTSFITETITRIECITRFYSDNGGELDVNLIVSQCLQLIRTRSNDYVDLTANGFKVFTSVNEGVKYLQDDLSDYTYFRAVIEISNKIEQISPITPPTGVDLQSVLQLEYKNSYVNRIIADGGIYESLECIPSDFLYNVT
tara:strand:- start:261 stop:845 length:585 start_codon:yes stop_codon:yes gene_type:complete